MERQHRRPSSWRPTNLFQTIFWIILLLTILQFIGQHQLSTTEFQKYQSLWSSSVGLPILLSSSSSSSSFQASSSASSVHNQALLTATREKKQIHQGFQQYSHNATRSKQLLSSSSSLQYHVVFSTSCAPQQHWESMVFFYHAYKVQQPGTVTRIVSGCKETEEREQLEFFQKYIQPMNPQKFQIHFTPNFANLKKDDNYHGSYKYMNKPYGLRHWMEHGYLNMSSSPSSSQHKNKFDNDIVILMDPDMILLRPLTHDFSDVDNHIWTGGDKKPPLTRVVKHGFPMAQQDGYLTNTWMGLNMSHIVGSNQHEPIPPPRDGPVHWNTGPPYLVTVRDMYQIASKWTDYTPRVLDVYPKLFAEMFGFIFATVELKLPFTMIKSIVVSVTTTSQREGWAFIDQLPDEQICDKSKRSSDTKLPIVLHYCERYMYGPMFFSKYRVKKNIMNCEKALMQPAPPSFVGQFDYTIEPPRADGRDHDTYKPKHTPIISPRISKREAFMLCGLTDSLNEALTHHKQTACPAGTANLSMTYTVFNDPSNT